MKMRAGSISRRLSIGNAARQRMKAVENQADGGMIHLAHDGPGFAVIPHVPSPCERLVTYAQPAFRRALAELAEIRDDAGRDPAARPATRSSTRAAGPRPAPASGRTCAPCDRRCAARSGSGMPFEIAERLEQRAGKPEVAQQRARLRGSDMLEVSRSFSKISTPWKPACGDGAQLGFQVAADRDRGDGGLHWRGASH